MAVVGSSPITRSHITRTLNATYAYLPTVGSATQMTGFSVVYGGTGCTLTNRTPTYCLHKATGQAVVRLNGKDHYLGKYVTNESQDAYDRLLAEWLAGGRRLPTAKTGDGLSVNEMLLAYWRWAEKNYRDGDGLVLEPGCGPGRFPFLAQKTYALSAWRPQRRGPECCTTGGCAGRRQVRRRAGVRRAGRRSCVHRRGTLLQEPGDADQDGARGRHPDRRSRSSCWSIATAPVGWRESAAVSA